MGFFKKQFGSGPESAKAYYKRGLAYCHEGQYDAGVRDFTKATAIKPDDAGAYSDVGIAYGRLGRYADEVASSNPGGAASHE